MSAVSLDVEPAFDELSQVKAQLGSLERLVKGLEKGSQNHVTAAAVVAGGQSPKKGDARDYTQCRSFKRYGSCPYGKDCNRPHSGPGDPGNTKTPAEFQCWNCKVFGQHWRWECPTVKATPKAKKFQITSEAIENAELPKGAKVGVPSLLGEYKQTLLSKGEILALQAKIKAAPVWKIGMGLDSMCSHTIFNCKP
jgi:hypothetical protein